MGTFMTEVLKMVKKCKIYQDKGSQESPAPRNLTKNFSLGAGFGRF